jgi:hypothetical protein
LFHCKIPESQVEDIYGVTCNIYFCDGISTADTTKHKMSYVMTLIGRDLEVRVCCRTGENLYLFWVQISSLSDCHCVS